MLTDGAVIPIRKKIKIESAKNMYTSLLCNPFIKNGKNL